MACNENIVKNMAMEVTRECHSKNVIVEADFVIFLIELLLKNPKYGKLFSKTLNRANLEFFVNDVVKKLVEAGVSLSIIKMQYIMHKNYDRLQKLINVHIEHIDNTLRPLVTEIIDDDPDLDDDEEMGKLFRKISVYLILASGLGSPSSLSYWNDYKSKMKSRLSSLRASNTRTGGGPADSKPLTDIEKKFVQLLGDDFGSGLAGARVEPFHYTLKEGMAALESVFNMQDCQSFVTLTRQEKQDQLAELLEIVSGVRLFNKRCGKAGEEIPDLPTNLVEAGTACLSSLSNTLLSIMQRVNMLTAVIEDRINFDDETGEVVVEISPKTGLTIDDYNYAFDLLAFNRQYELFVRMLLSNIETLVQGGSEAASRTKSVVRELHSVVEYRAAVPVATVFPLFSKLWTVWRDMQNIMYLVSTINKLAYTLQGIQEKTIVNSEFIDKLLQGNKKENAERLRYSVVSLKAFVSQGSQSKTEIAKKTSFMGMLGFCAVCLCVGALVPSSMRVNTVRYRGGNYGFCSLRMAARFSKDPERYMNGVLEYARNHPHIINLLDIHSEVEEVRGIEELVKKVERKVRLQDTEVQTELHPVPSNIDRDYTWNMWEWKRRACQWANIVKCETHSTQTDYSHLRSEIQCQTVEPRDKCLQTMAERGVNTLRDNYFIHGLRGLDTDPKAHIVDLTETHLGRRVKEASFSVCTWPCPGQSQTTLERSRKEVDMKNYDPEEDIESD